MQTVDYVIIGAGIVGLSIARELKRRDCSLSIIILEKESQTGKHSSGRNSGVLHSGIYYPPNTLKAKVCSEGATEMANYHKEHNLPLIKRGKLLVATNDYAEGEMELLLNRAKENKIDVEEIDEKILKEIEPEAKSATGRAILVPSTSVGSPQAVMQTMTQEVINLGVELYCNAVIKYVDHKNKALHMSDGLMISYGYVVNASGLYSDSIAHLFDVAKQYMLLPFKGVYWELDPKANFNLSHLIYPIPDLRVPFLGIHTTTSTDGKTYLGPTAVPALGRENYHGFEGVSGTELTKIIVQIGKQFKQGKNGFRRLAWQEGRRYFKPWFTAAVKEVLPRVKSEHLLSTEKVGIRAQMINKEDGTMVTDFLVENGPNSTHILNAISPAWTSAFPFARYVCDHFIDNNGNC